MPGTVSLAYCLWLVRPQTLEKNLLPPATFLNQHNFYQYYTYSYAKKSVALIIPHQTSFFLQ